MAISRLRLAQTKKTAITKQQRRQMAELLQQGKEESAKIRVENIIRDDMLIELLEYLELYCELLLARIGLLSSSPLAANSAPGELHVQVCPPGLEEAVKSIIFAAQYTEIKELMSVKDLLAHKFGKEFYLRALNDEETSTEARVPHKILSRCSVEPPSPELVRLYLSEIAKVYNVPFSELEVESDEEDYDGEGGTGIAVLDPPSFIEDDIEPKEAEKTEPISVLPPGMSTDNPQPSVSIPKGIAVTRKKRASDVGLNPQAAPAGGYAKKKVDDDLDALRKRFEALKKN
ncbi:unnamed protein product [Kuraishia capsulata CBS 1993]|uniref:DUF292 domain protein n=1 Tax=Kuraishia capsulata CBS 1993 TaxID=1382522 RepID=W6MJW8_9ASCO|nr:uncharacterized protein KUCA_T00002808001 [Kuraishia capsulata CBS 1993]CDK26834.1 unnamed protein product [Kuraishia capsulata CBS 1993]